MRRELTMLERGVVRVVLGLIGVAVAALLLTVAVSVFAIVAVVVFLAIALAVVLRALGFQGAKWEVRINHGPAWPEAAAPVDVEGETLRLPSPDHPGPQIIELEPSQEGGTDFRRPPPD